MKGMTAQERADLDFAEGLAMARHARAMKERGLHAEAIKHYREAEALWHRGLLQEGLRADIGERFESNLRMLADDLAELGEQPTGGDPTLTRVARNEAPARQAVIEVERRRSALLATLLNIDQIPPEDRRSYVEAGSRSTGSAGPQVQRGWNMSTLPSILTPVQRGKPGHGTPPEKVAALPPSGAGSTSLGRIRASLRDLPHTALIYLESRSTGTQVLVVTDTSVGQLDLPLSLEDVTTMRAEFRRDAPRSVGTTMEQMEQVVDRNGPDSGTAHSEEGKTRERGPVNYANQQSVGKLEAQQLQGTLGGKSFSQPTLAFTIERHAHLLGERLWGKLHPHLQQLGVEQLVLMPDAFLALLPLHAAPLPNAVQEGTEVGGLTDRQERPVQHEQRDDQGHPVVREWVQDRYTVAYAQSAAALELCRKRLAERPGTTTGWSAFAQGAATYNVEKIASMASGVLAQLLADDRMGPGTITWTSDFSAGAEEAVTTLTKASAGAKLLYFHCHGRFDPARPLNAALLLDADPPAEVNATDLLGLAPALQSSVLAVLAVCEGGEVVMQVSPSYQGFPLSLLQAGLPVVLAAPWRLNEPATPLLLSEFFTWVAEGDTVAEALRKAQNWLRGARREEIATKLKAMSERVENSYLPEEEQEDTPLLLRYPLVELEVTGSMLHSVLSESALLDREEVLRLLWRMREDYSRVARDESLRKGTDTPYLFRAYELACEMSSTLWLNLRNNPDLDAFRVQVERLLEYPFSSPYYWGGLQAIGAALEARLSGTGAGAP